MRKLLQQNTSNGISFTLAGKWDAERISGAPTVIQMGQTTRRRMPTELGRELPYSIQHGQAGSGDSGFNVRRTSNGGSMWAARLCGLSGVPFRAGSLVAFALAVSAAGALAGGFLRG